MKQILKSILFGIVTLNMAYNAAAFEVYSQIEMLYPGGVLDHNGNPITSANYEIRFGTFTFDPNFALNNSAIFSNKDNYATLLSNFVQLFKFDGSEGDTATETNSGTPVVNAELGAAAGGPGQFYAYMFTDNENTWITNYNFFSGKFMYGWIVNKTDFSKQLIYANGQKFAGGTDPFIDANANLVLNPSNPVIVGSAPDSNTLQLVPEPSAALMVLAGLGFQALARRRRA